MEAKKGTGKRKGFCALISVDIRNAFNSARYKICIDSMMGKKVPDYLLRMIDNYLSSRWVIYEGDTWTLKEEMTCGASEGSRVGPFVWNVMYDDFLRMDLPAGTTIVGFADDSLVVCAFENAGILELRINESLWRVKRWLDTRGLEMALEKTEALLVTDKRSYNLPQNVLGGLKVLWSRSLKYLGVQPDRRLSFGEHLNIAAAKAIQCGANLARLMPHWWPQGSEEKAGGDRGPLEAVLRGSAVGFGNQKPGHLEKAVFGTERCCAESHLSLPNFVNECRASPGERSANRSIGEGKARCLPAP